MLKSSFASTIIFIYGPAWDPDAAILFLEIKIGRIWILHLRYTRTHERILLLKTDLDFPSLWLPLILVFILCL
jgi:hypothetical protein